MTKRIAPAGRRRAGFGAARLLCSASLSALVVFGLPSIAHAQDQDRYWDANGTATGSGGNGDWNTSAPVWSESNSDVLGPYRTWDNNALDNAIFGITAGGTTTTVGTVNLIEPIRVHNMTFQTVNNWVINGNTLTLGGTAPTINTIGNTTINSVIAGTSGLTKIGGAQLFLTGANTFSGGITLGGGTLRVSAAPATTSRPRRTPVLLSIPGPPTGLLPSAAARPSRSAVPGRGLPFLQVAAISVSLAARD